MAVAAAKAGMDEKTARKWLRAGTLPSQCKMERHWRTRADPFVGVWPEIETILERAPSVQEKALFDYLCRKHEGRFQEKELKRLDRFEALLIDDLGYVQQSREEMEVLFTLLAHRYEHRSVLLTSNLVFSEWENIFKDPMTTAAAVDRLVHHSVILELNLRSFRMETAQKKRARGRK